MSGARPPLDQFLASYPDDDACLEYLWRRHYSPDGATAHCPKCAVVRRFHRVAARRSWSCDSCGHHLHPTAGTIFAKSSTPLRSWFHAVWLLSEAGEEPPAALLEREVGLSRKTARRLATLIRAELESHPFDFDEDASNRASSVAQPHELIDTSGSGRLVDTSGSGRLVDIAGSGLPVGGDGGAAISAPLGGLHGIAVDARGNLYLADRNSHVVRKVGTDGTISTVAGCGLPGYSGDSGPALAAQLDRPTGVAIDGEGNLLIADTWNHVVRKVDSSGMIWTIAGRGIPGVDGDGGPAGLARLRCCHRVLPFGDGLLVSEYYGHRIRFVDRVGFIATFAGNGLPSTSGDGGAALSAGIPFPVGLARDAGGNVYVAQASDRSPDSRVRRIDPSGTITTVAGTGMPGFGGDGGPATAALLHNPVDVLVDGSGTVLVSDYFNNRVRAIRPDGTITTVAGAGRPGFDTGNVAPSAPLRLPAGLAVDAAGHLLVADTGNHRIRRLARPIR